MAVVTEPFVPALAPRVARLVVFTGAGIIVGLALALLLVALIATRFFEFQVLTVRSGSMAPAIHSGDLILVKPVAIDHVQSGDVVLFASGGDRIPTVHRVAGINTVDVELRDQDGVTTETLTEHRLVTQGDANPLPDASEVTAANLQGEVWFTIPNGGAIGALPLQGALLGFALLTTAAWVRFILLTLVACSWAALSVASAILQSDAFAWQSSASVRGAALVATIEQRLPVAKPATSEIEPRPSNQTAQSGPASPTIEPPTPAREKVETPPAVPSPRAPEATAMATPAPPPSAPKDAVDNKADLQNSKSDNPHGPVATR